jgi:flagellar biosynthesis GTPase FlhF
MRRCRLVGWFCYRVPVRAGGKVNSRKRSRDGAILCWRWRSWDKQPQNVPGQGQDRMAHKGSLVSDKEILQVVNENFIEMILDMVNQNVQETLKKFQDNKNREFEKAQEEIKETIKALYKHQSETKNTINKEINELRTKIENIKEETTQDMENLRKKNETELQNKMEGQSSRIQQTEDRMSELEMKW